MHTKATEAHCIDTEEENQGGLPKDENPSNASTISPRPGLNEASSSEEVMPNGCGNY